MKKSKQNPFLDLNQDEAIELLFNKKGNLIHKKDLEKLYYQLYKAAYRKGYNKGKKWHWS